MSRYKGQGINTIARALEPNLFTFPFNKRATASLTVEICLQSFVSKSFCSSSSFPTHLKKRSKLPPYQQRREFRQCPILQELIPQDRLMNLWGLDSGQKKVPISL